jgi:hypothetical protein
MRCCRGSIAPASPWRATRAVSVNDVTEAIEAIYAKGWSDGLPCVPPTRELVDACVRASGRDPEELVGEIPPQGGRATIERVAANAVMAGCLPEYMPVVVTAIEAMLEERFNLRGVQGSTHLCTPLVIVNGPIAERLSINGGANCFGQGWRANATIGRAVKLVLTNLGGATPGSADKATFGHPGKYTYCIAENEAENPWEPLHVERDFAPEDSCVTVYPAEAPHNVNQPSSDEPRDLLLTVAWSMNALGNVHFRVMGESLVVFGPEHSQAIAAGGWTKQAAREFLFEHARRPMPEIRIGGHHRESTRQSLWPKWIDPEDDSQHVPIARRAEDIGIIVAGGPGRHSVYLPCWGSRSVTRKISE